MDKFEIINTEDGSLSIYSGPYQEACHNLSGAYSETLHNFVQGCELEVISKEEISILEIGFGTGVGAVCTLENTNKKIHFVSFEKYEEMVKLAQKLYPLYQNLQKTEFGYELQTDRLLLQIYIGDARKEVKRFSRPFDAIFQDPFSPKKNPELWTTQWFLDLFELSHNETILSTYSSSVSIRKSLVEAGWIIEDRKGFGNKRLATRAKKTGEINREIRERLDRSPVQPLHDSILSASFFYSDQSK